MTQIKYRAKPVEIEAIQFDGTYVNAKVIMDWVGNSFTMMWHYAEVDNFCAALTIDTLEGRMWAKPNDYIIKGTRGEFYPCKAEIFEEKYERI
jgi:hypothetical protein